METPQIFVDDEAPSPHDSLVVDVLLPTDLVDVANFSVKLQEESKTLENPKQDQVANFSVKVQEETKTVENPKQDQMAYDELHEILSWMPAKAAIKCSSPLCKWLSNIRSDARFIQKQCIRSRGQDNGFFLQHDKKDNEKTLNEFEFHILPSETASTFGIPRESLDCLPQFGRILSSSNGLLLLGNQPSNGNYIYMVCNPTTRQCARLPLPNGLKLKVKPNNPITPLITCYPWEDAVLDKVDFPNDYTIALPLIYKQDWQEVNDFMETTHELQFLIYSHGRWDEELCNISIKGRTVRFDMPVGIFSAAAEGLIVHYLCDGGKIGRGDRDTFTVEPHIAAFNICEKKLSREIKVPEEALERKVELEFNRCTWLFKWKETSLCLVKWMRKSKGTIKAWVLDKYGCEGESWRLVVDISERDLFPWEIDVISVGVAGGGKGLLIATKGVGPVGPVGSGLFLYGVEGENRGRLDRVGNHHLSVDRSLDPYSEAGVEFLPYANTLRPVSVKNAKTVTY